MAPAPSTATAALDWNEPFAVGDPEPLRVGVGLLARVVGPLLSLATFVAAVMQFRGLDFSRIIALLPASPLFWGVFAVGYMIGPLVDWIIFRRLWRIPVSGIAPLLGKLIGNDLLFGYIGEVYFYDWARRRVRLVGSPFGAVKDVAILSAIAGNLVTLLMVVAAWPFAALLPLGGHERELGISIAVVLLSSAFVMLFRTRLFSLTRPELWFVFIAQMTRIVVSTGLAALLWHLALPDVAFSWWLLLATVRLLIARLPFLPNKDVAFAGVAVVLIGHGGDISALLAMLAGVIVTTHLVLGTGLLAGHFAREGESR